VPNLSHQYETGSISSDEFYGQVVARCGLSISKTDFREAFTTIFTKIPPTLQLIRDLKPRYKLGLLSNTNEWDYQAEIETLEVYQLFDAITASFQVGVMKPGERIYRDSLAKLRLPPEACIYIDDITEYVEAAQRLGMFGVHYASPELLTDSLRKLGVTI
jgi:putative hydrolase of the HAD superfamily